MKRGHCRLKWMVACVDGAPGTCGAWSLRPRACPAQPACVPQVSACGMASATTMLLALVPAGGHIVTTTDCYRRTRQVGAALGGQMLCCSLVPADRLPSERRFYSIFSCFRKRRPPLLLTTHVLPVDHPTPLPLFLGLFVSAVHPAVPAQDGHRCHGDRPLGPGSPGRCAGAVPGALSRFECLVPCRPADVKPHTSVIAPGCSHIVSTWLLVCLCAHKLFGFLVGYKVSNTICRPQVSLFFSENPTNPCELEAGGSRWCSE